MVVARNPKRGAHSSMSRDEFRADQHACRQRCRVVFVPDIRHGRFMTHDRLMYRVIVHEPNEHADQKHLASIQIVRAWPKVRGKKARAADKLERQRARHAA